MRRSFIILPIILLLIIQGNLFSNSVEIISPTIEQNSINVSPKYYSKNIIQISTLNQIQNINDDLNGSYILISDIDASNTRNWNQGNGFQPIGSDFPFNGSLDGNGHFISNLYINRTEDNNCGLFGTISNNTMISNLILFNCSIRGNSSIGGITGASYGEIINCSVTGSIYGFSVVGGVVGLNFNNVSSCSFNGEVIGQWDVGGLIGNCPSGMIEQSKSEGSIKGLHRVGGLCGYVRNNFVRQCYSSGDVEGLDSIGGFIGYHFRGKITDCYSSMKVHGEDEVGGLVGFNYDEIINCYSSGEVIGTTHTGGLIGYDHGTTSNSFWDIETSKQTSSDGGTGLNSNEMKKQNTYQSINWNFDLIWDIIESKSYPILRFFNYKFNINKMNNTIVDEDSNMNIYCHLTSNIPGLMNPIWIINSNSLNWLNIDTNGRIFGIPRNEDVGTSWVNITAKLNETIHDYLNFTLIVQNTNDDPEILTEELPSAFESRQYSFIVKKIDEDPTNDELTWNFKTNAKFINFDFGNSRIYGMPSVDDIGTWWILLNLSDGKNGFDERNFSLSVILYNDPPIITDIQIPDLIEDIGFNINLEATDVDSSQDQFKWDIITKASFIIIDEQTGELYGTPTNSDVGTWWVLINLSDGNDGFDEMNISLKVTNVNDDPEILNFKIHDIYEDELFFIDHDAVDIDPTNDVLIWEMETSASFIQIDQTTGNITGTPTNDDVGTWWVMVTVSDGNGGEDSRNYTITVRNINDAPELKQTDVRFTMEEDSKEVTFDLNDFFYDIEGNALFFDFNRPNNLTITENDDIINVIPKLNWFGSEEVEFSANDGLLTTTLIVTFEVTSVNDAPSDVKIISESKYLEGGDQWVNSSASDVDIPYGDSLIFRWSSDIIGEIGFGQSINLSLPSGHHLITLNVTDEEGLSSEITKKIEIIPLSSENPSNNQKKFPILFTVSICISLLILICIFIFIIFKKKSRDGDVSSIITSQITESNSIHFSTQPHEVSDYEVSDHHLPKE